MGFCKIKRREKADSYKEEWWPPEDKVIYKLYTILDLRKQKSMLGKTQTPDGSQCVDIYRLGNGIKVSFLGQYHISITLSFS